MSNTNRDYLIICDVKNSKITINRPLKFYTTDKNTSNIFVKLVTQIVNDDGITEYVDIQNASGYKVTLRLIKPSGEKKTIDAEQLRSESIFLIDLPDDYKDIRGTYKCELLTTTTVNNIQELNTSDMFTYEVKESILAETTEIIETAGVTTEQLMNEIDAIKATYKAVTKTSQLTNDSDFVNSTYVTGKINEAKANIPTKTSQLTNDSNFVTESYVSGMINGTTVTPVTKTSQLTNDSGFVTNTYVTTQINNAKVTKTSQLTNDSGFVTSSYVNEAIANADVSVDLSDYATKNDLTTKQNTLVSGTNIKTINGVSILGSGDITISGGESGGSETSEVTNTYAIKYNTAFNKDNGELLDPGGSGTYGTYAAYIPLQLGVEYTVTGTSSNFSWLTILGYDANKTYTGALTSGSANAAPYIFTATEDTAYIRVGVMNSTSITVTGMETVSPSDYATKTELATKQDELISGTNIKTINGLSLLGSGNLTISSEGGSGNGMTSVITFGADNTGVNDCTSAIQDALNYSNTTGQTIYFPPGKYRVLGTLYIGTYASIKGDNGTICGFNEHNAGAQKNDVLWLTYPDILFQGDKKDETVLQECRIGIQGITFQCMQNENASTAFYKLNLADSHIHDCMFRSYGTVFLGAMCYVTTIQHNWFLDCRKYFLKSKNISGLTDTRPAAMTDVFIMNNYINGSILSTDAVAFDIHYPNYSTVTNNFIDFWYKGFDISGGQGLIISNNIFQFCMIGIFLEMAYSITISNNCFGLMTSANHRYPWENVGTNISSWNTSWVGIHMSFQCGEIMITGNQGMSVDKVVRINGFGYRNVSVRDNCCYLVNNIVDKVSMAADSSMLSDGVNVFVQSTTTS